MKNIIPLSIILIITLTACSRGVNSSEMLVVQPTIYPSQSIQEYFPLKQGAYWVYQGNVKWTTPNSADVVEGEITWKMEVKQVFRRHNIVGYEMLGAPWDLAWYEKGKEPSRYGIIQAGGKFYITSLDAIWRLSDETDDLRALVNENEIFLDIPLIQGKKFCDTLSITREDSMYCWVVGDATQTDASSIKGIESSTTLMEFPVYMSTLPDFSMIQFIQGVGISRYVYSHHGTVSEVDVRLVEYHAGE